MPKFTYVKRKGKYLVIKENGSSEVFTEKEFKAFCKKENWNPN